MIEPVLFTYGVVTHAFKLQGLQLHYKDLYDTEIHPQTQTALSS